MRKIQHGFTPPCVFVLRQAYCVRYHLDTNYKLQGCCVQQASTTLKNWSGPPWGRPELVCALDFNVLTGLWNPTWTNSKIWIFAHFDHWSPHFDHLWWSFKEKVLFWGGGLKGPPFGPSRSPIHTFLTNLKILTPGKIFMTLGKFL